MLLSELVADLVNLFCFPLSLVSFYAKSQVRTFSPHSDWMSAGAGKYRKKLLSAKIPRRQCVIDSAGFILLLATVDFTDPYPSMHCTPGYRNHLAQTCRLCLIVYFRSRSHSHHKQVQTETPSSKGTVSVCMNPTALKPP